MAHARRHSALRDQLIERIETLQPTLRKRFEGALPAELRQRLGGVTLHQIEAIRVIATRGSVTVGELAEAMDAASMSTATQMADRLEKLELLQRAHDTEDRRIVRLILTPSATRLVAEFKTVHRNTLRMLLSELSDSELETYAALMARVTQATGEPS